MHYSILANKDALGIAAATHGATILRKVIVEKGAANIIIATGASQFEMLSHLVAAPGIDWGCVTMFHLDEYIGIPITHPASFRKYIQERFIQKLPTSLRAAHFVTGDGPNPEQVCVDLDKIIIRHPIDVAFIGIGENAHIAFNDPPADFTTEKPYIIVELDEDCRKQQLGEGWFPSLQAVPSRAISMGVRQVLKSKTIVCSVPDARKARAVLMTVEGPLTPLCPASCLRLHTDFHLFLDHGSASLLSPLVTGLGCR